MTPLTLEEIEEFVEQQTVFANWEMSSIESDMFLTRLNKFADTAKAFHKLKAVNEKFIAYMLEDNGDAMTENDCAEYLKSLMKENGL